MSGLYGTHVLISEHFSVTTAVLDCNMGNYYIYTPARNDVLLIFGLKKKDLLVMVHWSLQVGEHALHDPPEAASYIPASHEVNPQRWPHFQSPERPG